MLYSARISGRYFRVGILDMPEASEYGIAFKSAELRTSVLSEWASSVKSGKSGQTAGSGTSGVHVAAVH